jgi:kynureninase
MQFEVSLDFAKQLDALDKLASFRHKFIQPIYGGKGHTYFLGNSLGLQPNTAKTYIDKILKDWATLGVESFFHGNEPWIDYHDKLTGTLAHITGSKPNEIVVMNQLTVNLHLMMVSFYKPTPQRYKIICEAKAFPSDQYSFESHVKHHSFNSDDTIVEVAPRDGEHTLRTEDIIAAIENNSNETALVLFSGINYYTGQLFDMPAIASAAKKAGAMVGFDLAHAAGNVDMQLHAWQVDFACWCSYKYLNSGPGAVGGVFIHEKHHSKNLPRYAGWWGYDKATRFKMEKGFVPMAGAEGWQLSTPSLLLYASHRAALEIIEDAGWENIQAKRKLMSQYLWFLFGELIIKSGNKIEIITPSNEEERGSQVSILMLQNGKEVYDVLMKEGFMVDWREPNVVRFAPVPLYNTFEEVWCFVNAFKEILSK